MNLKRRTKIIDLSRKKMKELDSLTEKTKDKVEKSKISEKDVSKIIHKSRNIKE